MGEFSFVIMTDSHLAAGAHCVQHYWNRWLDTRDRDVLITAVEAANAMRPDFVVHLGDLTDNSQPDSFRLGAEILARLNCPLHYTPGNHDTYVTGARELAAELLRLPPPPLYRAIEFAGCRLVFIDSSYWEYKDGTVHEHYDEEKCRGLCIPDFQMDWLRDELDRNPEKPTICFTHHVMAVRDDYPIARLPGIDAENTAETAKPRDESAEPCRVEKSRLPVAWGPFETFRPFVARYPCIKAVFYGDGHWHDCMVEDGVLYCQTAALIEYPNEIRQVRVGTDCIEVEALPLARGDFARLSYIPAWGNRWTAGRPIDRHYCHRFSEARG